MNWQVVKTLIVKDTTLFFRNRFFALITVLGLVFYVAIYYVMSSSVNEVLELALYAPVVPPVFEQAQQAQGLIIKTLDSAEALKAAVADGQYPAGVVLPDDFVADLEAGNQVRVDVFLPSDVPEEIEGAAAALLQEMAYLQSGQRPTVELSRQVLGRDLAGMQLAARDHLLPLIAVIVLLTETLGLASLISEEVVGGTVQALLITPMTVSSFFLGKGVTGVGLAFSQVALFLTLTGGLGQQPLLILVTLFWGALLVTGIAFLLASLSKDLMSVVASGIPVLILMIVPAFAVMFPGAVSDWIKIIPSYYLVNAVHRAANLNAGWDELWGDLLILMGFSIFFVGLGMTALRRKST